MKAGAKGLVILVVGVLSALCFQNCSKSMNSGLESSLDVSRSLQSATTSQDHVYGNGTGIEGKIVYRSHNVKLCGDEQSVVSEIVRDESGNLVMIKDNCKPIEPKPVASSVVQSPPTPQVLTIDGINFEETQTQSFVNSGDSFIFSVCRSQTWVKDVVVGYADGVLRVVKDESPRGYSFRGQFAMLMPALYRGQMEALTTEELQNVPKIRQIYDTPMIPMAPFANQHPKIEIQFRVPESADPYIDQSLLDPRQFVVWLFKKSYENIQHGEIINGQLNMPRRDGQNTFWAPAHCDRLTDFSLELQDTGDL